MAIVSYTLKNGEIRYRVRLWNGYQHKTVGTFRTRKQADECQIRHKHGQYELRAKGLKETHATFREFFENIFLPGKIAKKCASNTLRDYRNKFYYYVEPKLGNRKMSEVTAEELQDFFGYIATVLGARKYNDLRTFIAMIYNKAQKMGYVVHKPIVHIERQQLPPNDRRIKYWEEPEKEKFLEWCFRTGCPRRFLYYLVLEGCGLRPEEVIALKRCDLFLHQDQPYLEVRRIYSIASRSIENSTKNHRARSVGLDATLCRMLAEQLLSHQSEFVFPNRKDQHYHYRDLFTRFSNDCRKAGVPCIGLHGLRHTFGSNYVRLGGKVENLQRILGHKDITTTMIYVHINDETIKKNTCLSTLRGCDRTREDTGISHFLANDENPVGQRDVRSPVVRAV